jgi:CBS-domain-containing membrane protein
MSDVLLGLGVRLRWQRLVRRHDHRGALGLLAMVNALVSIGLIALVAEFTHHPLVFPSLGPTAFLLIYQPYATGAWPRNALCGHAIGAGSGLVSLWAFGLVHAGPALSHMTLHRVGAAALSLGLTTGGMIWAGTPHPPAAATTLIVGLRLLDTPAALGMLMLGVILLMVQGFAVNRLAGIDYPLWAARPRAPHGFAELRQVRFGLDSEGPGRGGRSRRRHRRVGSALLGAAESGAPGVPRHDR